MLKSSCCALVLLMGLAGCDASPGDRVDEAEALIEEQLERAEIAVEEALQDATEKTEKAFEDAARAVDDAAEEALDEALHDAKKQLAD